MTVPPQRARIDAYAALCFIGASVALIRPLAAFTAVLTAGALTYADRRVSKGGFLK